MNAAEFRTDFDTADTPGIRVFDRKRGCFITEKVLGDRWMRLAYSPVYRPLTQWLFFRTGWASRLLGRYCDSTLSRRKIRPTIEKLDIDVSEFADPVESFRTFNEFFVRRLRPDARPFDPDPGVLVSPADARTLVFPELAGGQALPVKGARITVAQLLGPRGAEFAPRFAGGTAVVARLCPADYHRYHYPAAGRTVRQWRISGRYDSVNPLVLALGIPVFRENLREVTVLEFERFGLSAMLEVGAFGVAGIVQTHTDDEFRKMQEKGYFRFGGSTIILLFRSGVLRLDPDLIERSAENIETLLRAGESIAHP